MKIHSREQSTSGPVIVRSNHSILQLYGQRTDAQLSAVVWGEKQKYRLLRLMLKCGRSEYLSKSSNYTEVIRNLNTSVLSNYPATKNQSRKPRFLRQIRCSEQMLRFWKGISDNPHRVRVEKHKNTKISNAFICQQSLLKILFVLYCQKGQLLLEGFCIINFHSLLLHIIEFLMFLFPFRTFYLCICILLFLFDQYKMLDKSQIKRIDSSRSYQSKLNQSLTQKRISEKHFSQISSRFDYYKQTINEYSTQKQSTIQTQFQSKQALIGPNQFYYVKSERDRFHHFEFITLELLQNIVQKVSVELKKHEKPNNQKEKKKNHFNLYEKQIKTFVFPSKYVNNNAKSILLGSSQKSKSEIYCSTGNKQKDQYYIYLISKSKEQKPTWIYCIERYTIKSVQQTDKKMVLINFQAILGVPKVTSLSLNIISYIFDRNQQPIYEDFLFNSKNRIKFIQQSLIKQLKIKFKQCQKQQKIAHLSFKRQDRIPPQHIALYTKLKAAIYKYNIQCNSHSPKLSHYSLDNLICRFFKYRQYNYQKSLASIQSYLQWYKSMRQKYTQASFQDFEKCKIYEIIGKDNQGRVLLLFRPHNIFSEILVDEERYVDYSLYMLELFIEDNTEGYIDQFILLADYTLFGRENFNYSIAKKVSDMANELFPDRQYRLIVFGLGTFSYFVYKMIKPILPSFITQKIIVFGSDKQQLLEYLKQLLDVSQLTEEITQQNKQIIYKRQ